MRTYPSCAPKIPKHAHKTMQRNLKEDLEEPSNSVDGRCRGREKHSKMFAEAVLVVEARWKFSLASILDQRFIQMEKIIYALNCPLSGPLRSPHLPPFMSLFRGLMCRWSW
ncbi:hypothetical protein ANCDUO_16060 [Ancylostoma duodenale]|uniref:Uncharacterized protein n=1 Tax=Ancylostoma duodenale TaxID=51022 RepID=A0A0C2G4D2_9BILA|nr:hypothetical protein ANCDUO_16060 [Ancylostoma duodenale]